MVDKRHWDKLNLDISILGFGCMRFPVKENGEIDEEKAEAMIDKAYANGVNYYDTAYFYHNGASEVAVGKFLSKYPRESYYLATKLPVMLLDSLDKAQEIFDEQMKRLGLDYIDFYLLHGLNKHTFDITKNLGVIDFCEKLRKEGRIRYLGFSFHDSYDVFEEILRHYNWDFCQIQLNYMDIDEQAGMKGYELTKSLDIPLVIMEPAKGGSLSVLPEEVSAPLTKLDPAGSDTSWAMRWIGSLDNVKVVLSGMTEMAHLDDNLKTFTDFRPLSAEEQSAIEEVRAAFSRRVKNGCTACRYCMPCPAGVDIPGNFMIWNKYGMYGNKRDAAFGWTGGPFAVKDEAKAKNCIECGVCEDKCPQNLPIREDLKKVQKELDEVAASFKR
ncbi:MAG TPA: aldo/keto reductase [Papillibacter sp.]|jgi:predicted aldo/keto reductase-like oxidoreductase|nr:aldo/keto reductase [Papillibacter sp.]